MKKQILILLAAILSLTSISYADTAINWRTYGFNATERFNIERVIALFEGALGDCQPLWNQTFTFRKETMPDPNVLASTSIGTMTVCASGHFVSSAPVIRLNTFYTLSPEDFRDVLIHELGHCFGWLHGIWQIQDQGYGGVVLPTLVSEDGLEYIGPAASIFHDIYGEEQPFWSDGHLGLEYTLGPQFEINDLDIMDPDLEANATVSHLFWGVIEDNGWPIIWSNAKTGIGHTICPRRLRDPSIVTHYP